MTGQDLARELAQRHDLPVGEATRLVRTVFELITNGLGRARVVRINTFGRFSVFHRPERRIRDVRTQEERRVAPKAQIAFRAAPQLKRAILD